jgi:two-component system chemotaxis sensor kinase CheA
MEDFEEELKRDFLKEATDLLADAENAFLRLEQSKDDTSILDEIFRLAHNLKGTSMAVGLDQLSELTHTAENLILKLKEGELKITDDIVTVLLNFLDRVNKMVETLENDLNATFDNADMIQQINAAIEGDTTESTAAKTEPSLEEPVDPVETEKPSPGVMYTDIDDIDPALLQDDLFEEGPETTPIASQPVVEAVPKPAEITPVEEQPQKEAPKKTPPPSSKPKEDESIRVSLGRIAKLNNIVGELVILQTVLDQRRYSYIQDDLSNKSISQMGKLFKEVQEVSMSLRMIPMKNTFQKMSRIVRDTSRKLNKKVNLNLVGENTEVDKTVLEKLADPLVHIVRNAIDHGLENTDDRVKAGKTEEGNVEIMAFHEGSNLVIQVTDDGKGINPDIIRRKAIEKGLIRADADIADHKIIQYIFHPGFSTKEQVSDVSGRGVGMDVVKTNIEALSGEVKLQSKIGHGSSFKVILPLTMAIIDGIVTTSLDERYIIPLSQAHEFVKVDEQNLFTSTSLGECLKLRGEVLPLFDLGGALNPNKGKKNEISVGKTAIIVRASDKIFAVKFDEIHNQQQVVIKKLGDEIKNRKGFMGSSILGDGRPTFIIDLIDLFATSLAQRKLKPDSIEQSAA